MFSFRWLHRIIRRNMNPIDPERARNIKEKLAIAYMLMGWNALGYVMYMCYTGRADWPKAAGLKTEEEINKRPGVYFAEVLGIEKATVLRYKGFKKVEEYHYNANENIEEQLE